MFDFRSGLLFLLLMVSWAIPVRAEEKLGIFFPSARTPKDLQKAFADDAALRNVKVTAYGTFEDFQTAISSEDLTYALVPSAYTQFYDDFDALFQLTLDGKSSFQDIVVTTDTKWTEDKLKQGIVGVINLVGREKTKPMIDQLFSNKPFKRLKQVSKVQDLYPLLALGNAQYAVFTPHDLDLVKAEFASKPIQVFRTGEVAYPIIAVRKNKKGKTGDTFLKLSPTTLKSVGTNGIQSSNK